MSYDEIELKKPTSTLVKPIKIDSYGKFFKELVKMVIKGVSKDLSGAADSLSKLLAVAGLSDSESEIAWQLVSRSMGKAVYELIRENKHFFDHLNEDELPEKIEDQIMDGELYINNQFFNDPRQSKIVKDMQEYMEKWLISAGVEKEIAKSLVYRLPYYFVNALNEEWRKDSSKYKALKEYYDTPFFKAELIEEEWRQYSAWLDKQIHKSVFDESFCLKQIYVPLSAYYEVSAEKEDDPSAFYKNSSEKKGKLPEITRRIVVDLEDSLEKWLDTGNKDDAIRIISSGPGSGKSSFAKIFCSKQTKKRRVLFIPLYSFTLINNDVVEGIKKYLREKELLKIMENYDSERDLLIVFDGLDELTQQNQSWEDTAKLFVNSADNYVNIKNDDALKVNILIIGRDVSVQPKFFRKEEQILHILPYFKAQKDIEKHEEQEKCKYVDEKKLLIEDKRDFWWKIYGNLTGKDHKGLPDKLRGEKLDEITIYPLLNYLVARSYTEGKEFSAKTSINTVYEDMINGVFDRKYEKMHKVFQKIKQAIGQDIKIGHFFVLLEGISASAWHGGAERKATISDIKTQYRNETEGLDSKEKEELYGIKMDKLLEQSIKTDSLLVDNLFIAFYFMQGSDKETFIFTHKSFCEYLVARRVVRQLEMTLVMREKNEKDSEKGWSNKDALVKWLTLCGKSPLDIYNFEFIRNEIILRSKKENGKNEIEKWQKMLCELIGYMLREGMPFECIPRVNFKEECIQSINAETALLAVLSACSAVTGEVSDIAWENETSAGEWISRLFGQFKFGIQALARKCLIHINFKDQNMVMIDLAYSDLSHSDLSGVNLFGANLIRTYLYGTNLHGAELRVANLYGADLYRANFGTNDLSEANLARANLGKADLTGVDLSLVNLTGADLSYANLSGANLRYSHLPFTNLRHANLSGADLSWNNLESVEFFEANLSHANLTGANLRGANLSRANLSGADLREADIRGVNLSKVDFSDSKIDWIIHNEHPTWTSQTKTTLLEINRERLNKYGKYVNS